MVISTEHDVTTGSSQYEFIINSLQTVNHSQTPWIILAGHRYTHSYHRPATSQCFFLLYCRPMYTVSSQDFKEQSITDTLQAHLEPLFRVVFVILVSA